MFPTSLRVTGIPALIHLLVLGCLLCLGAAGIDEKKQDTDAEVHTFMYSMTSPITAIFNSNPRIISLIKSLVLLFKQVDEAIQELITAHGRSTRKDETIGACNSKDTSWLKVVTTFLQSHGWRLENDSDCVTKLYDFPAGTQIIFRDLINEIAKIARQFQPRTAVGAGKNWTRPDTHLFHTYEEGSIICSLHGTAGFRIDGIWYIAIGYTFMEEYQVLPDLKRMCITEFQTIQEGKLVAARMRLPIYPGVGTVHEMVENATTAMSIWSGPPTPGWFRAESVSNNTAVKKALEKAKASETWIESSLRLSEIVLRVLPMVLNFIPVTHKTDHIGLKIISAILSDVVTAFPLGMKGVDFVLVGRERFVSTFITIGDVGLKEDTSIAAEIWAAECGLRDDDHDVGLIGIGFIVVSVTMMTVGIGIEVVSSGWFSRIGGWEGLISIVSKGVMWEFGMRWRRRFYVRVIELLRRVVMFPLLVLRKMSDEGPVYRSVDSFRQ